MKIAILLGSLNRGGTETLLLDVLSHAKASPIKVVCIYRGEGLLSNEYRATGVSMFRVSPKHKLDVSYILKIRRIIKKNGTQIAHAHQPLDALYAYLATIGMGVKIVLTLHGFDFDYPKIAKWILRFMHKRVDQIIFVSKSQESYFLDKYKFRKSITGVLYNGISFEKFNKIDHSSIKNEFAIPDDYLLLGSVGNFNAVRDQLSICKFLRLLKKEEIPFSFIFAGARSEAEPRYWEDCVQYCKDNGLEENVHFAGSRKDIPNLLSQLDAFVYSTDHDTFGIAVLEAIYMGLPVFVNNSDVIVEVTGNGEHAIVFETKNEYDLLTRFLNFYQHTDVYKKRAQRNSKWVFETYSVHNHLKNLEKIYADIL